MCRALVQSSPTTAMLLEVGKALYHGQKFRGMTVLRPAWAYESRYPLGVEIPLGLPAAVEIMRAQSAKPLSPPAKTTAPPAYLPAYTVRGSVEGSDTWRSDRLVGLLAEPY